MSERLDELKKEATDLGVKFSANIGEDKLAAKIEEYYESQETSGKEIQEAVKANEAKEAEEKSEEKSAVSGNNGKVTRVAKAKKAEELARKTRVVTIIDNDQRVNNQTTVATVNCSNMYFDLGTVYIPLNTPVEVRQGHIDSLKEIMIPNHVKDPKTGLHRVTLRNRYTISYEDFDTSK